jgi:hypothetical protein
MYYHSVLHVVQVLEPLAFSIPKIILLVNRFPTYLHLYSLYVCNFAIIFISNSSGI